MKVNFIAKDERPGSGVYSIVLNSAIIDAEVDLMVGVSKIGIASVIVKDDQLIVTADVPQEYFDLHPRGIFGFVEEVKEDGRIIIYTKLKHVTLHKNGEGFLTGYPTIREQLNTINI